MSTFGERLRSERERLGLGQVEFAELGGVKKLAQINYEKGERAPDAAYLVGVAKAGVDLLYVLLGQRAIPLRAAVSEEQEALLKAFDLLPSEERKALRCIADAAARASPKPKKRD